MKHCSNKYCWVDEIITDVISEKADKEDNRDVWDVEVKTSSETKEITEIIKTIKNFFLLLICKLIMFLYAFIPSLIKQL